MNQQQIATLADQVIRSIAQRADIGTIDQETLFHPFRAPI